MKAALQAAGSVKRRKKPGSHRKRRPRRALPGMMLHIDGRDHRWFGDERRHELIVILDDATSEIYYAQLVEAESTRTVLAALREVIETRGVFCSLYSDRAGHFFVTPKRGERGDPSRPTQVGRAPAGSRYLMIPAYSPQARGRMERSYGTRQGRLPQGLRLRGIGDVEAANAFLREECIATFDAHFAVAAAQKGSAFFRLRHRDLDWIFSAQYERSVNQDNTVLLGNRIFQLEKTRWRNTLAGQTVISRTSRRTRLDPSRPASDSAIRLRRVAAPGTQTAWHATAADWNSRLNRNARLCLNWTLRLQTSGI